MGTFAEKVSYLNDTKQLIKDAIKNKGVTVEEDTPFREYANKIASISASVDSIEPIVLTGNCSAVFGRGGQMKWVFDIIGNKISSQDVTNAEYMFNNVDNVEYIPFEINGTGADGYPGYITLSYMFQNCNNLKAVPKINNCRPQHLKSIFAYCYNLREIPEDIDDWFDWSYIDTNTNGYGPGDRDHTFWYCYSLRSVPLKFLNHINTYVSSTSNDYLPYNGLFFRCAALDEVIDLPCIDTVYPRTTNMFQGTFDYCLRLKNITFECQEDGTPYTRSWKNQLISLTAFVGYASPDKSQGSTSMNDNYILNYNSGITSDKEVSLNNGMYEALKNDPDWYATWQTYSRYNHDSAVNTINSLPDTSAYLATSGGTNTIKFDGNSGALTDGGAINTLTEEEIAVATAKGWTVTFI